MTTPDSSSPPLRRIDGLGEFCKAAFIERIPEIEVATDRETALARLRDSHANLLDDAGFSRTNVAFAEQVHGGDSAIVTEGSDQPVQGVDGLMTDVVGLCLAIYVADCAAVWIADPIAKAVALVHSGRKGTEANIVGRTIDQFCDRFGGRADDLQIVVSPCIRPPHYEVDFAASIVRQAESAGVRSIRDCGEDTATDLNRFYSYRVEQGQTGRMLAVIEIKS